MITIGICIGVWLILGIMAYSLACRLWGPAPTWGWLTIFLGPIFLVTLCFLED